MKHIVTFVSAASEEPDGDMPEGRWIAQILFESLPMMGIKTEEIDNYNDIAWSINCEIDGFKIWFFVGNPKVTGYQWQLIVPHQSRFLSLIMRHRGRAERARLAQAIHDTLAHQPNISEIQWFKRFRPGLKGSPTPN